VVQLGNFFEVMTMDFVWGILVGLFLSTCIHWLFLKKQKAEAAKDKMGDFHQLSLKVKDMEIRVRSLEDQVWKT
jgi:cbb3-type cytochrome oxidase subunit 3